MKIKYTSSCTNEVVEVNGEIFSDLEPEIQKKIFHEVIDKIFEVGGYFYQDDLLNLLRTNFIPTTSFYDKEPCEQCDHHYEKEEYDI